MKLAIPLYETRVSPRFCYSQGVLIVENNGQQEIRRKILGLEKYHPEDIPEILSKEGVEIVISGGMNHYFQNLFRTRGIQVIWGIIGEPDDALAAFKAGKLISGMGCCPQGGRGRKRLCCDLRRLEKGEERSSYSSEAI
jgi:predicted Fe-Mo cluster-binding NifX family protein